ncbi:hypothetical protein Moror_17393 [Moniliophthora roreri MCA 2997]|uniref:Methyltransferase domain-containing protein n=2 Tax=Moniliophthora roreri TaxID=221103 RepID=V2XXV8_MONRO|nr:hypothetical protein Moror_17393 [Moniliophthora roreri MCA 2997]
MASKSLKSNYIFLDRGDAERERLNKQFWLYKNHHGRGLIIDPTVNIPSDGAVLDAGTGTGVWILSLAKELPLTVSLYAIDLAPTLWPSDIPPNVHYTVASITSLPTDWSNKFDLVNQSLLAAALKTTDWPIAISELYRVTKPGGHVQLMEGVGVVSYPQAPPGSAGSIILQTVMRMQEKAGLLDDRLKEVPKMLENAGFVDIKVEVKPSPKGKEVMDISRRTLVAIKDMIILNEGFGLVKDGEEYDTLVERYFREAEESGLPLGMEMCLVCARKPVIA